MKFTGMILAAGFGKRMMPLTKNKPKPLIEINGITLLENSINFLTKLGCEDIIINGHYKYLQLQEYIKQNYSNKNIKFVYEKDILDTGGGVINAIPYFSNKNIIVINSDVYWQKKNLLDVKLLINYYLKNINMYLLLSRKNMSYGLNKNAGDFIIRDGKVYKFNNDKEIIYYSGLQILHKTHLEFFNNKKFSFNDIWSYFINNKSLYGHIMTSDWYHVGDLQGLNIAKKLDLIKIF
jgi:MurNAc alpha-1-phosphate uridylyltransferase